MAHPYITTTASHPAPTPHMSAKNNFKVGINITIIKLLLACGVGGGRKRKKEKKSPKAKKKKKGLVETSFITLKELCNFHDFRPIRKALLALPFRSMFASKIFKNYTTIIIFDFSLFLDQLTQI